MYIYILGYVIKSNYDIRVCLPKWGMPNFMALFMRNNDDHAAKKHGVGLYKKKKHQSLQSLGLASEQLLIHRVVCPSESQ